MSLSSQVSRVLDEEHRATIDLLGRAEQLLRSGADAPWPALAAELARHLERDVGRHFDFEERQLFTRLADVGDGGMVALLTEEHDAIREVAAELLPLARDAAGGTLAPALKPLVMELVERQVSHVQKETMALLPMLDDLLDPDTDRALAFEYAAG